MSQSDEFSLTHNGVNRKGCFESVLNSYILFFYWRVCMAIVLNLYYNGISGNARAFAEEMERSGTADVIRAEKGNLRYEYFSPLSDPETILLIDAWTDQEALDRHHASLMMQKIAELREKYDLHMRVERFISDDNGMPSQNVRFLRK